MLTKEICKRCLNLRSQSEPYTLAWSDRDDDRWERGIAYCGNKADSFVQICDPPKLTCRYALEHIVIGGEKETLRANAK